MGDLLERTLALYTESWKKDHDEVMRKYKEADRLKEFVSFGIFLFDRLFHALERGGTDSCASVAPACESFKEWYGASSIALSRIEDLEADDFPVELANELRERHKHAGAILEELQDSSRVVERWRNGHSISRDAFRVELQDRVHG